MTDYLDRIMVLTGQPNRAAAAAWLEKNNRQRDRKQATTVTDPNTIIKNAPKKAARIYEDCRTQVREVLSDRMAPEAGKLWKAGELRSEAEGKLLELKLEIAEAAPKALAQLEKQRDKLRPQVAYELHEQYARRFQRLADKGIPVETLVEEHSADPVAVRVLQAEVYSLARGANPRDPDSADAPQAMLQQAAYDIYGDDYRAAHDSIQELEKAVNLAQYAANSAGSMVSKNKLDELVIPDSAA